MKEINRELSFLFPQVFVAILRALGLLTRLVYSLQVRYYFLLEKIILHSFCAEKLFSLHWNNYVKGLT